jgi:hypothetical protein
MSDTDEIRAALSDALRLPGEVQARPGAATMIRARARARRRTAVVSFVVALPACLVVVALLVAGNGSGARTVSPPATHGGATASPSTPATPVTQIAIPPGPRRLATPIEIRPVLRAYLTCPAHAQTVPATVGSDCYRLGPAAIVIRRVQDLSTGLATLPNGTAADQYELNLRMTAHDTAAFSALTAVSLHKQVAYVINGNVRLAPSIGGHITEGEIQIPLPVDAGAAQAFVTELTG